ncbi:MAG TPA: hypothetical protein VIM71_10480 [Lacunisphaera sp.]
MPGSVYRWILLQPLLRGSLLSLAVAGFCVACLLLPSVASPAACAPAIAATAAGPTQAVDECTEWPRTVLRLWFLLPHILPLPDR